MPDTYVPTLNIHEAVLRFREYGISMSEVALSAGLEQGSFPFGTCITMKQEKGKDRRKFEIYEKLLNEYLDARAVPKEGAT